MDIKKYVGTKAFYKRTLYIAVPIMIQGVASSSISLLNTIMVGRCGTETLSAAAISNQLIFIYLMCVNGAIAGPGAGAAIATDIARVIECLIMVLWTWKHAKKLQFAQGLFHSFKVPVGLASKSLGKGAPLLISKFLWSGAVTIMMQGISTRGLSAVAGYNIANTANNIFANLFGALSAALFIMIGQLLGAGKIKEAQDTNRKLMVFSVAFGVVLGVIMVIVTPMIPDLLHADAEVKNISIHIMLIMATALPFCAYTNAAGSTLRVGGKTALAFIIEYGFTWGICVPLYVIMPRFTSMSILPLYFCCQYLELIKAFIESRFIRKGDWAQNLIEKV